MFKRIKYYYLYIKFVLDLSIKKLYLCKLDQEVYYVYR